MNRVSSKDTGYTIVETMIFLAVSGALFLSAMLMLNGQQRKTEFGTAIRELDTKLQSIIGNVSVGYYNNPGAITCSKDISAPYGPTITPSSSTQGQNADCTYLGQVILPNASNDGLEIYSVAGLRLDNASGKEVGNFSEAQPKIITQTVENYNFPSGIEMYFPSAESIKIDGNPSAESIGVFASFNKYGAGANATLESGSTKSNLYTFPTPLPGIEGYLNTNPSPVSASSVIQICITDGKQVGVFVINSGSTNVTISDVCP